MNEPKKAEIELVGGTTITGKVVTADVDAAKQAAVGEGNTQTDTGGGAAFGQDVTAGGNVTGRDSQTQIDARSDQRREEQREDRRQYERRTDLRTYEERDDRRGGNVTFQSQDSAEIWKELRAVTKEIESVRFLLDNLPKRVEDLEAVRVKVVEPVPLALQMPTLQSQWLTWGAIAAIAFFASRELNRGKA